MPKKQRITYTIDEFLISKMDELEDWELELYMCPCCVDRAEEMAESRAWRAHYGEKKFNRCPDDDDLDRDRMWVAHYEQFHGMTSDEFHGYDEDRCELDEAGAWARHYAKHHMMTEKEFFDGGHERTEHARASHVHD